jgi:recombination protein RecT
MCKKTVLRRLCKLIDLDFGSKERADAFEEGGDNKVTDKKYVEKAADVYAEPIEAEATEVEEPNWFDDAEVTRQAEEVFK